jgi:putative transposase
MSVARSTLRYESRLAKRDAPAVAVMQELAAQYPRYGYRRIQVFLERQGHRMSADRAHRLWRKCGLQVPRKRPRRRIASGRPRPLPETGAGYLWAYDFVFDACVSVLPHVIFLPFASCGFLPSGRIACIGST